MANDIVYQGPSPDIARAVPHNADSNNEEWDLPPEELGYGPRPPGAGPEHTPKILAGAREAAEDARQTRQQGETEFPSIRESDAADLTQTRWDWGDTRTWLWFAGMFFGFLLLVALCYFLPYGRHASPPPIRVY